MFAVRRIKPGIKAGKMARRTTQSAQYQGLALSVGRMASPPRGIAGWSSGWEFQLKNVTGVTDTCAKARDGGWLNV